MKRKWSAGKIAAVICGSIVAAIILLVTLYIGVYQLLRGILTICAENENYQQAYDYDHDADDYNYDHDDYNNDSEEGGKEKEWFEGHEHDSYDDGENEPSEYYEFHDAIGEDLSYWVEFETQDEVVGENENISLSVIYPVFYGEEEVDLRAVNNEVQKELLEIQNYVYSVSEWLSDNEEFTFEADSYVTYMDEDILSIAYLEYGYLNGQYYESYVISVNIDMNSKMALTNTQLLNIDDDFSIEFRNRCEKQNGEIESLYYYSDQEITKLLTSENNLIIFYTPLGMEVGFNYNYGWVTVTYTDYQKYQRKF